MSEALFPILNIAILGSVLLFAVLELKNVQQPARSRRR